jgi:anti-sigma B factor antagonist
MQQFRTIEQPVDDETHMLVVEGDVDMRSCEEFRDAIAEAAGDGKPKLVVDMSDVPFMDSSGLASLIGAQKALHGRVRIVAICPRNLRRVFEVTRLDTIITVVSSLPEALVA